MVIYQSKRKLIHFPLKLPPTSSSRASLTADPRCLPLSTPLFILLPCSEYSDCLSPELLFTTFTLHCAHHRPPAISIHPSACPSCGLLESNACDLFSFGLQGQEWSTEVCPWDLRYPYVEPLVLSP